MAVWSDLPANVKNTILKFYLQDKIVYLGKLPGLEDQVKCLPILLVSKHFFGRKKILKTMLNHSTILLLHPVALMFTKLVVESSLLKRVKKVRVRIDMDILTKEASPADKLPNAADYFTPSMLKAVFPNLQSVDFKMYSGKTTLQPLVKVTLKNTKELKGEGSAPKVTDVIVPTKDGKAYPVESFLQGMVAHELPPKRFITPWYLQMERDFASDGFHITITFDAHIVYATPFCGGGLSTPSQEVTISLRDLCLKFKTFVGKEVQIQQTFGPPFKVWRAIYHPWNDKHYENPFDSNGRARGPEIETILYTKKKD